MNEPFAIDSVAWWIDGPVRTMFVIATYEAVWMIWRRKRRHCEKSPTNPCQNCKLDAGRLAGFCPHCGAAMVVCKAARYQDGSLKTHYENERPHHSRGPCRRCSLDLLYGEGKPPVAKPQGDVCTNPIVPPPNPSMLAERILTCPKCGEQTDGEIHRGCKWVHGRRGWRELGVYDG